jgi:EAL domain-containing protein (putative c-di-GMP-specific phosphodiesterase class I)
VKPATLRACTVLLVDDDPDLLREYGKTLERTGVTVLVAGDGASALGSLAQNKVDVIVTDLNMPVMSGMEFLRAVREVDLDIPLVLITGMPEIDTAMAAVEYGAFQYLTKPLNPEQLRITVAQASQFHGLARLQRQASQLDELPRVRLPDRASLEARFTKALEKLWIAFQPIVRWSNRSVFSYEALVRSSEESLNNPVALFEAADLLQRTEELGRVIRRKVGEAVPLARPDALLFVNVHPSDLDDEELYSESSPLAPFATRIVYEITERSELSRVTQLATRLLRLRSGGARIAIDDLGAGYSSLSSFIHLDPEFVKLDMSLIRDVHLSPRKLSLVRGLTHVCERELNIKVICEGVETSSELEVLTHEGLELFQGYYFAKPGPAFPTPKFDQAGDD